MKTPGHVPIEDFNLACECVRFFSDTLQAIVDDLNSSSMDMRILKPTTLAKSREASAKLKELYKILDRQKVELCIKDRSHH